MTVLVSKQTDLRPQIPCDFFVVSLLEDEETE